MKTQKHNFEQTCISMLKLLQLNVVPTHSGHQPLDQLNEGYRQCDQLLNYIAESLPSYTFPSPTARMNFYKEILPEVIAVKIFCRERYYLQINRTGCTSDTLSMYYQSQLALLEGIEDRFGFFKGYLRNGMTALDELYYLPGEKMDAVMLPEVSLPSAIGLGCCTYLFSRFRAGGIMRKLLATRIKGAEHELDEESLSTPHPVAMQQVATTMFNLSVDQLGMGARAALDAGVISGKSFQQICQELAPRISTPEKQVVSGGSLRSNAYTGEDVDKHTLIRLLEKMIRLIGGY